MVCIAIIYFDYFSDEPTVYYLVIYTFQAQCPHFSHFHFIYMLSE